MKITVEKIDDINFIISGSVENSLIQEKVAKLKEEAAKDTKNNEATDETIQQDAAGQAFKDFIDAGIKEAGIEVESLLGQPALKKYEQLENGIYFEVELSISPVINVDIDYMKFIPDYTKPVADEKAIDEKLAEFSTKQAPFKAIAQAKAVEDGDVAIIDFAGYIDDKLFEGGSAEKFNIKVGSKSFIEGFEEQLLGMQYNEEKTIIVKFPDDYQAADLAGKEAKFVVKLHEIHEQIAEEPDDAFAQSVLSDPKATLATLRGKLADQIISEDVSKVYMSELKPKMVDGLLAAFDFTLPNNIVEQEIDAKVREKTRAYTEEQHKVIRDDKGKFAELRESVREEARKSIKTTLIVEALAEKEGVVVNDQELQAALGYQAMMTGQDAQDVVKYYEDNNLMVSAKMGLVEDKLFGILLGFHQA